MNVSVIGFEMFIEYEEMLGNGYIYYIFLGIIWGVWLTVNYFYSVVILCIILVKW